MVKARVFHNWSEREFVARLDYLWRVFVDITLITLMDYKTPHGVSASSELG